jgi:hypothetical protein
VARQRVRLAQLGDGTDAGHIDGRHRARGERLRVREHVVDGLDDLARHVDLLEQREPLVPWALPEDLAARGEQCFATPSIG